MPSSILVTAKIHPDLDGVACAYAYGQLLRMQGKNAIGGIFGQMHVEAAYLVDRFKIHDVIHDPIEAFDAFILVDASDMAGMPSVLRPEAVVEVIDHREVHVANELFPHAKIQIERVGSAATLIVEKYRSSHQSIHPHSAVLLYGAIYSNTLNFQASIATERDKTAADWLQSQIEIPASLVEDMFTAKTRFTSENLSDALTIDAKQISVGRYRIGIAQLEILDLNQLVVDRLGDILVTINRMKDEQRLDASLLTAIDLREGFNVFITPDAELQSALSKALKVTFKNNIARTGGLLLRKQLIPLLKSALEQ